MSTDRSASPRRLSREDWIAFARKTLVQSGIDDVKIDRLAKKAKVTRGSFYWHFKDRQDLLDALLQDWEIRNHVEVASIRTRWEYDEPDLTDVAAIWLGEERAFLDFDIAIRSWARKVRAVADVVWRVDSAWIGLLQDMFLAAGYDGNDALVRARITYFHQIGYHALSFREDRAERIALIPFYYRALTGREPGKRLNSLIQRASSPAKDRKDRHQTPSPK